MGSSPPSATAAFYDVGQVSGYRCPCFLISKMRGMIVIAPKHCIEMCVCSSGYIVAVSC